MSSELENNIKEQVMGKPAPLHDDLAAYLEDDKMFGPWVRHPLVNAPLLDPEYAGLLNEQYNHKMVALMNALADGDWNRYVFLHERPWRLSAFLSLRDEPTNKQYWRLLREVYVDSESIRHDRKAWDKALRSDRLRRCEMMLPDEFERWRNLPDMVEVYQGCTSELDDGWSWTTSYTTAAWFANRFADIEHSRPRIRSAIVERKHVVALIDSRGEHEVLVDPDEITELPS